MKINSVVYKFKTNNNRNLEVLESPTFLKSTTLYKLRRSVAENHGLRTRDVRTKQTWSTSYVMA